jgi:hypothetical protein
LFAPDGTQIDAVTFGAQADDISQGRFPDGSSKIYFLPVSTPATDNIFSLQLQAISGGGNSFVFRWPSIAGQNYQVEYKNTLDAPAWIPLGDSIAGDGGSLSFTDSVPVSQRFFRISIQSANNP